MKASIKKFLQFNGKNIYFLHAHGQYLVAIRPIVEALGIEYAWQLKKLKKHPIWGSVWLKSTILDANNHRQTMVVLPERYVYTWLATLPIRTDEHLEYVKECIDVLYDHFHGAITGRREILARKLEIQMEKQELQEVLEQDPKFKKYQQLIAEEMREGKLLKELDNEIIRNQLKLFDDEH